MSLLYLALSVFKFQFVALIRERPAEFLTYVRFCCLTLCFLIIINQYEQVADECVQMHGGNGFMWEYNVTRAYADGRVARIYGGANEIMKELIARDIVK